MKIRGAVLESLGERAPYAESRPLQLRELELDEPGSGELLVRVEAAGLCHSDLSVVNGSRGRPVPMLLGHEASGVIEQLGSGVSDLIVGDRVVMTFLPRCGQCRGCRSGGRIPCEPGSLANSAGTLLSGEIRLHDAEGRDVFHHLGVSGFATHAVVDRRSVVRVDSDVPADVAALLGCAVLTGGGAIVNAGRPVAGERVIVVGLGGVGMAALITACSLPDVEVVGVDFSAEKLATARELGAHLTFTPDEASEAGISGSVVLEAAGAAAALETAIMLTSPGGRTVTVGLPHPDARISVSPLGLVAEGRSIIGSYLGSAVPERDIPTFVSLWREGNLPVESLISARIPFDQINLGMDDLAAGTSIRQLITFDS